MTARFQNLISNEWLAGAGCAQDSNPSDLDDIVGDYAQADRAQTLSAVAAAKSSFEHWRHSPIQQRFDLLDAVGSEILVRREELATLLAREEGKTVAEARGEVVRAGQIFKFFAGETIRQRGDLLDSTRAGLTVEVTREAVGPIAVITPWNFPIAIPAWKIAPALAYGNTVVFKPADLVPASAYALSEVLQRAGVPPGVFNLVMGRGSVVGDALVTHPDIKAITFTGSDATGRRIVQQAAARMAKVQCEMGGKNPLVVLDDADLSIAADVAVNGAYFATGQRCTASSRLIVTDGIRARFIAAVIERLAALRVDHALDPTTQIGPVVSADQLEQDLRYIELGRQEGATLAFGGQPLQRARRGHYLQPALFTDTTPSMRIAQEEIFGPVACVISARDYDEALAIANDTRFGLSSGIVTTSLKYASHFKLHSQAGMVMVNAPTAGVDYHVPFGGRKDSSYGPREQGHYAREFFTSVKTTYLAS